MSTSLVGQGDSLFFSLSTTVRKRRPVPPHPLRRGGSGPPAGVLPRLARCRGCLPHVLPTPEVRGPMTQPPGRLDVAAPAGLSPMTAVRWRMLALLLAFSFLSWFNRVSL